MATWVATFFFPVLAEKRGDRVEARRLWRIVIDACPGDPETMSRGETSS